MQYELTLSYIIIIIIAQLLIDTRVTCTTAQYEEVKRSNDNNE